LKAPKFIYGENKKFIHKSNPLNSLMGIPYTLHPTPYTLHPTPHTLLTVTNF